jgi:transposase-like protein
MLDPHKLQAHVKQHPNATLKELQKVFGVSHHAVRVWLRQREFSDSTATDPATPNLKHESREESQGQKQPEFFPEMLVLYPEAFPYLHQPTKMRIVYHVSVKRTLF